MTPRTQYLREGPRRSTRPGLRPLLCAAFPSREELRRSFERGTLIRIVYLVCPLQREDSPLSPSICHLECRDERQDLSDELGDFIVFRE